LSPVSLLFGGLSSRRPELHPRTCHTPFVLAVLTLVQASIPVLQPFLTVSLRRSSRCIDSSICHLPTLCSVSAEQHSTQLHPISAHYTSLCLFHEVFKYQSLVRQPCVRRFNVRCQKTVKACKCCDCRGSFFWTTCSTHLTLGLRNVM
jgi:hypothetical protein